MTNSNQLPFKLIRASLWGYHAFSEKYLMDITIFYGIKIVTASDYTGIMRLNIRKTSRETFYTISISIRQPRELSKLNRKREP